MSSPFTLPPGFLPHPFFNTQHLLALEAWDKDLVDLTEDEKFAIAVALGADLVHERRGDGWVWGTKHPMALQKIRGEWRLVERVGP